MTVWHTRPPLQAINERNVGSLCSHLGIVFTEVGDNYLKAEMPVDERTMQPFGIMHGGASCALAETVGSIAGNFCIDFSTHICLGLDININHLRPVPHGKVIATAKPYHLGRTTQVWSIEIHNEKGQPVSVSRLTLAVVHRVDKK